MKKIAIDIVLLPDEKMQKNCREINQSIGGKIDFVHTGKVPHISLMMGVLSEDKLQEIFQIITEISKKISPIELVGRLDAEYLVEDMGENLVSYGIVDNSKLKEIFLELTKKIRPNFKYENISTDMFYQPEQIEMKSIIVDSYKNKTPEEYSSHITLGIGELQSEHANMIHFTVPKLAVYQLGNYCTCDNKLLEIEL